MISDSLTFLHAARFQHCRAVVDKYFDGYFTLQFMSAGDLQLRYDQKYYELSGRWLWPAMPGPKTFFTAADDGGSWDHRYVAFEGPLVNSWIAEGLFPQFPQQAPADDDFDRRFDELILCAGDMTRLGRLRGINILESILIDLLELRQQSDMSQQWLGGVLRVLENSDTASINYNELARSVGMSASTLRRRFKQQTGVSIHNFAIRSRMAAAKNMLIESDMPIKQIAEKLGFNDVYYFSRRFSSFAGLPPGRFRKALSQ